MGMVFSKMKRLAENKLKANVVDCCIAIPIDFTDLQRKAVIDAATYAGLNPLQRQFGYSANRILLESGQKDDNEFDDGGEACSGTGEGLAVGSISGKFDTEVADENIEQSSSQGKRKRSKKLFFRDGTSGLDALQRLADLNHQK